MTKNYAEKHAARAHAAAHGLPYRHALALVRAASFDTKSIAPYCLRVLIEAIEGCGITHWASVDGWDGVERATITDVGGECFVLTVDLVRPLVVSFLIENPDWQPFDVDSYFADDVIQRTLFGGVIYRLDARHSRYRVA